MKPKQLIQIAQFDAGVHWIYARVLEVTDEGVRVRVVHPGNIDHDKELIVDAKDCRTKDDVQKLLDLAMQHHAGGKKPHQVSRELAKQDPWVEYALTPSERGPAIGHEGLHRIHGNKIGLIVHYEQQLKRFGASK